MKSIFTTLAVCCLLYSTLAQTPDWAWVRDGRGSAQEEATDIAVDGAGNVYVVGSYNSSVMTAASASLSNSGTTGSSEIFLLKYDRTGALLWAKQASGSSDDFGTSVSTDGAGNAYITGWFQSPTLTFGTITVNNYTTSGFEDVFVAKYSPSGNVLWARAYGGTQQEYAHSIAADATGNVFITGEFYSLSVVFGNFGVINSGASDGFIAKLDASGTPQWAKRIGGGNIDYSRSVATDGSGNAYVTGSYNSSTVPSFSPALTNAGGFDVFYAKYDAVGNNVLSGRFGAAGDEHCYEITARSNGEFFLMGMFMSTSIMFGSTTLTNGTMGDRFFVKLGTTATVLWAQRSAGDPGVTRGDLATDSQGDLYAAGGFTLSALSFGSVTLGASTGFDGFVVKFSGSSGAAIWARKTGSPSFEELSAVAVGPGGYVHVAGYYTSALAIGSHSLTAQGGTEAFLSKMCFAPPPPLSAGSATVCAGSSGTLTVNVPPGTTANWFNTATGGALLSGNSSFVTAGTGTYYVASKDTNSGCAMLSYTRLAATLYNFPSSNPSVSLSGNTLIANGQGSFIAWYNCASGTTVSGQPTGSFVLTASGNYAVIMSLNGCADTSACNSYSYDPGTNTVVVTTGIADHHPNKISAYPNPATGKIYLLTQTGGEFHIIDSRGRQCMSLDIEAYSQKEISISGLKPGIYFIISATRTKRTSFVILDD
jgi:hypothetical protein